MLNLSSAHETSPHIVSIQILSNIRADITASQRLTASAGGILLWITGMILLSIGSASRVDAQSGIEGYWEDRFAREVDGGLGIRAEVVETHPQTGEVYVGGNFRRFGDIDLNFVARWTGDGWEPLGQGTNGRVVAVAFAPNGDIVIGGTFTVAYQMDGTPVEAVRVARWDGTAWHAIGGGVGTGVQAVAVMPSGEIVVGGHFDTAENLGGQIVDVPNIAVWDGSEWSSPGGGVSNTVRALAVHPTSGHLIAGGSFVEAYDGDGSPVDGTRSVARWNGSQWSDVGGGFSGGLDDLAIGVDGTIYAGGSGPPGKIAGFDGDDWSTLGGGISGVYVRAVAAGNGKVFVGGQFAGGINSDGSALPSTHVAAWDLNRGEWISLEPGTSNTVSSLSYDGTGVFVAGGYNWAGPFPASFLSRWVDSPPPYPAAEVTFRVDTRRLDDFNMINLSRSVMVSVFNGANAKRFVMLDPDGDGIYSVRVPQPIGTNLNYAFFLDVDRDGFDRNDTWIYERDVSTNPRKLTIQSSDPVVLPAVYFDDLPPVAVADDYEASHLFSLRSGNPSRLTFFRNTNQRGGAVDLEDLDRPIRMAALWYTNDPGGVAPDEIVNIARSTYWRFETTPLAAAFTGTLSFEFLPGVSVPEDVRMLYRPSSDSLWQIVESTVDPEGEGLTAENITRLSGEWTLGSVSRLNSLTDDPPGIVSDPRPTAGTLNAPLTPTLTWEHADNAERYDVYIWPEGEPEPNVPTVANLGQPLYHAFGLTGSAGTEVINWRVVARNINGDTPGPVWSFEMGAAADLTAGEVQAPSSGFSGQEIEVTWVVENAGGGGTNVPSWTDHIYLSESAAYDPSTAVSLGTVRNVSYLNPGESYSGRATVELPDGIQGTYHVIVFADRSERGGGVLAEPDEANNTAASEPMVVTLTPFADLQVTSIIAPSNSFSGDEINISWTVTNEGSGQTDVPVWFDTIFLSEDEELNFNFAPQGGQTTIRITDPDLATVEHSGPLEAGESYTVNHTVRLPDDAIGDHHLFVYTDIRGGFKQPERGDVYEFNQELNNWASEAIQITLTPPPDLVVTSVEAPATAQSGQTVELKWTVTNEGPGATRAEVWSDHVYFASTPEFDPSTATRLGTFRHTGSLANDQDYEATARIRVPDGVQGDGYFFVHTDANGSVFEHTFGENNRTRNDEPSTLSRAPYPDLVVSDISVNPSVATAGQQVSVSYVITNVGTAAASTWSDNIHVSESPQWEPEAAFHVGTVARQASLSPEESREQSVVITLPPQLDGTYYVYVKTDAEDQLFEYPDEAGNIGRSRGNTAGSYPPVDLRAEILTAPSAVISGSLLEIEFRVRNVGQGRTAADGWTDDVYLSDDPELDVETDILLARIVRQGPLPAGAQYTVRRDGTVPQGLSGEYHLIVRTDVEGLVADVDSENNRVHAPVSITLPPLVDLRVTEIEAPPQIAAGEAVTVRWTVANTGEGAIENGLWYDSIYLSQDNAVDRGDILLGTFEYAGDLAAGGAYEAAEAISLPAYNAGRYYLLVQTDQRGDVYEHEAEFNNTGNLRVDLTLPAPADLTVSDVSVPGQSVPGEPVSISWTLINQGEYPARGRMREAVFISADATWDPEDRLLGVVETDVDLSSGESSTIALEVDFGRTYAADRSGNLTGEMPGVEPGDYYAIVRTDIANNIRETNENNNTVSSASPTSTDVQILELGVPETILARAGQSRLFQLTTEAGRDLRIMLDSDVETAGNEIYVAYDRTPTAGGDFDYSASEPFTADVQLMVPSTEAGTYYVLVVSRTLPEIGASQNMSLLGEALDFSLASITPDLAGQGQITTTILGAGFRENSSVVLTNGSGGPHTGEVVDYVSTTELKVRFFLENATIGRYDVVVSNPGNESSIMEDSFEIEAARPLSIEDQVIASGVIRAEGTSRQIYEILNTSNRDIPVLTIQAFVPAYAAIRYHATPGLHAISDFIDDDDELFTDVEQIEDLSAVAFVARNLAPGSRHQLVFEFSDFAGATFLSSYLSQYLERDEFLTELATAVEATRLDLLSDREAADLEAAHYAATEEEFRTYVFEYLAGIGLLDDTDLEFEPLAQTTSASLNQIIEAGRVAPLSTGRTAPDPGYSASMVATSSAGRSAATSTWQPTPECAVAYERCVEDKTTWCSFGGFAYCQMVKLATLGWASLACRAASYRYCREVPRKLCLPVLRSCDPNDMIGPSGFGEEEWVSQDALLPYTIRFENDPERATAPAQVVTVNHPLDPTVDPRRFRLGTFGFGPFTFDPPENVSYYQTRLNVADSLGVNVDVTAGIDVISNNAFWIFKSVDPQTGDQPTNDPLAGFLPVNDNTKIGEGFATYTIRAAEEASTGDVIDAQAGIVFDINAPIDTPPIFNTVDATPPVSSVGVQPSRSDSALFYITWSGDDEGSGIRDYQLYVSRKGDPFEPYQTATADTSVLFQGELGNSYRFFTIATDNVGNAEPMKSRGEAVTVVAVEENEEPGVPRTFALHQNYPNPFNPRTTIPFDIAEPGDIQIAVYNLLGQRVLLERRDGMKPGHYQHSLDLSPFASGVYFYEIRVMDKNRIRFRDVRKFVLVK